MSAKLIGRIAVVCLLFNLPAAGAEEELEEKVRRLVEQLDAPRAAARAEAETELIALGEKARRFLPADSPQQSPDLRQRLTRVRQQLGTREAEAEVEESTDVRLGEAHTLGEALEAISRQSQIEFEFMTPADSRVTPYDSPLPFWHAVDYVLDQAELDIDIYGSDSTTLKLVPRAEGRPSRVDSAAYAGIYRLEPTVITSRRSLRRPELSGLSIEVEMSWKPGVSPIAVTLPLDQVTAKLDDGQTVRAQDSSRSIEPATRRDMASTDLHLPMQLPADQPGSIESLSGRIRSLLPSRQQRFEFPLHAVSSSEESGAVTVRLEDARLNGDLHEIRLGVEFDAPGAAMESHRRFLIDNEVFVMRGGTERVEHLGFQLYRQSPTGIGIAYLFDLGALAETSILVYETPTAVVANEVDFVITDIPLP